MTITDEARRAFIAGTGLIGSSIGLALRRAGWQVIGYDRNPLAAISAVEIGALDSSVDSLLDLPQVDLAVVATPPSATIPTVSSVISTGRASIVTDTASVKGPVVGAVNHACFIGSHPMAGSHRSGPSSAHPQLFKGAAWVVTPNTRFDQNPDALSPLIEATGSKRVVLDPYVHDDFVAIVSHVPHIVAAALAQTVADHGDRRLLLEVAGGGFHDMTRIAMSDAFLWSDICTSNRVAVGHALDDFIRVLAFVRNSLISGESLDPFFEGARAGLPESVRRGREAA